VIVQKPDLFIIVCAGFTQPVRVVDLRFILVIIVWSCHVQTVRTSARTCARTHTHDKHQTAILLRSCKSIPHGLVFRVAGLGVGCRAINI